MSTLYLGSELQSLANRLADVLIAHERQSDFFTPVTVVVPNRYLRKWLRLTLARKLGVCVNLQFFAFEEALWKLLREVDLRPHAAEPEALDENAYRLLVLSVLLEDRDPDLAILQQYIRMQTLPLTRLSCRHAWNLSERLAHLVQEYEYHRQDVLIQPWLRGQLGLAQVDDFSRAMERAQRALFTSITRADNGKRSLLSDHGGHNFKTLPQYAMELMEQPLAVRPNRLIHVFGLTQTTELYARVLSWLGEAFDIRVYHLNVLASRAPDRPSAAALQAIAQKYREPANPEHGNELLRLWGRACAESLGLMAGLLASGSYGAEVLEPAPARPLGPGNPKARAKKAAPTALSCLHDHLLGRPATRRLAQDRSIQIVGCPGIVREVETVYNSILDNLQHNPSLRQTDIAVLATDMPQYRPILQAVFERPPKRLRYNLVDFSAAGLSMLGQALLGMLDLALESFTRSHVFAVLLNPCFLARLGVDRAAALTWLEWAETLGICQGWDAAEKQDQGYPRSPFYAWRLALQRLRLGRYMEVSADDADEPAPRFGHVIPFADIQSADREQLDAFCRAVETLLPRLARLRHQSVSGQRWATDLQRLVQEFLDVPADRPEEEQVRAQVLAAVDRLALWDHLRPRSAPSAGLPLALVREYVQTQLEGLAGSHGEYLTGGVTLAALQPMRPVPCQLLYVIGLDATLFPGSNALSSFDLRGVRRESGDIRPAEDRIYLLLENLLAAQQKVYLLYNTRGQKDVTLLPSMPLQQLQRYLGDHVTSNAFETIAMPPFNDDDAYFNHAQQPEHQDVLVQYRDADRFIALNAAASQGRLTLDLLQQAELQAKKDTLRVDFAIAPEPRPSVVAPVTISVGELRRFLCFPAEATLRRHLGIEDDEESDALDEEPLVAPDAVARQLVRLSLHQLVRRAAAGDVNAALTDWPERFRALFADAQLRSRVPADAFGDIDFEALRGELQERIHGRGALEPFLRAHADMQSCGPALLGESFVPIGAKMRFPALRLRPGQELPAEADSEIRVVGSAPFAWFSKDTFEVLVVTTSKKVDARELCTPMIEPLLFYLALLANPEPNAKAIAAGEWLSRRHFHLHIAHAEGIQSWTYPIGLVSSEEARLYFVQLTRDFLDPAQLDLLPFELITIVTELRRAYDESTESRLSAEQYVELLGEKLADERDNAFNRVLRIPHIVDMAGAGIPEDALAKVQRRFRLLDRGPAQCRQGGAGRRGYKTRATP
jgi:exodeoxyribonuclease V gamma subunit